MTDPSFINRDERRGAVSFVGPVNYHSVGGAHFEVLFESGKSLHLEYVTGPEAKKSRQDLAASDDVYLVPNDNLFGAIKKALSQKETNDG